MATAARIGLTPPAISTIATAAKAANAAATDLDGLCKTKIGDLHREAVEGASFLGLHNEDLCAADAGHDSQPDGIGGASPQSASKWAARVERAR